MPEVKKESDYVNAKPSGYRIDTVTFRALLARCVFKLWRSRAAHQAAQKALVRYLEECLTLAADRVPPRVSLERSIIESLVTNRDYEYDCGMDADYGTPLTNKVHQVVKAARGEGIIWTNPAHKMPTVGALVSCLLRHHSTGKILENQLRKVQESDVDWRTADDNSEIGYDWEIIAWRQVF